MGGREEEVARLLDVYEASVRAKLEVRSNAVSLVIAIMHVGTGCVYIDIDIKTSDLSVKVSEVSV